MKILVFVFFTLLVMQVFAETGHDTTQAHGIPPTVKYQVVNVSILFVGLFLLLRKTVVTMFKSRQETFVAEAEKAQAIKKTAEAEFLDVQLKLNKLEGTKEDSIARAKIEAREYKEKLVQDASLLSKRIQSETDAMIKIELEKAKNELRNEMIKTSFSIAKEDLQKEVNDTEQLRLQREFVNDLKAVQ